MKKANRMKKTFVLLFAVLSPLLVKAQITGTGEIFRDVQTFEGKVVFVKEIILPSNDLNTNFSNLRNWANINFDKDPFNSSVNYDTKNNKIVARSRVELLLPVNSKGIREKLFMKFKVHAFLKDNLCILEITDINYINDAKANRNTLKQKVKAEDMITDAALAKEDADKGTRIDVRENTLYFYNDLANSLEKALNR